MDRDQHQAIVPIPKIFIVEDDLDLLDLIVYHLSLEAYDLVPLHNGKDVVERVTNEKPDLLLLDIDLPGVNGVEICRRIRRFSTVPIIFITAYSREEDLVQGLAAGADDYVKKPFRIAELLARVSAQLRRTITYGERSRNATIDIGSLLIDREQRRVYRDDEEILLTPHEFRLLELFATHVNQVLDAEFLLEAVWGVQHETANDLLRQGVRRLRQKIETDHTNPQIIVTRPGLGYLLLGHPESGRAMQR